MVGKSSKQEMVGWPCKTMILGKSHAMKRIARYRTVVLQDPQPNRPNPNRNVMKGTDWLISLFY